MPPLPHKLGRDLLESHRYVVDGLKAHHNKAELYKAMEDVVNTLWMFGFEVKHICTEHLSWHKARDQLNPDGSTADGKFDADQEHEVVFHHSYGFRKDTLGVNICGSNLNRTQG